MVLIRGSMRDRIGAAMKSTQDEVDNDRLPNACCPRCGYDQRGVVAGWIDACDLRSTCSECGLAIDWSDALSPQRKRPRWSIEFARSAPSFLDRSLRTIMVAHQPWKTWRSLKMTHPIVWGRLVLWWALLLMVGTVLIYTAIRVGFALAVHSSFMQVNAKTNVTCFDLCWRSVFTPTSQTSPGTLTWSGQTSGYPPPFYWSRYSGWNTAVLQKRAIWAIVFAALVLLLSPMAFISLPVSRRKAKVRWAHLFRIMLHSGALLTIPFILLVAGLLFVPGNLFAADVLIGLTVMTATLGIPIAALFLWRSAAKHYLLMTEPTFVAISVTVLACLAAGVLTFYLRNPMDIVEFMHWGRRAIG